MTGAMVAGYPVMKIGGVFKYRHVYVMAQHLGRKLAPGEVVHHIDGKRSNFELSNLQLLPSRAAHIELHRQEALQAAGIPTHFRHCAYCKKYAEPSAFVAKVKKKGTEYYHAVCHQAYMKKYLAAYRLKQKEPK